MYQYYLKVVFRARETYALLNNEHKTSGDNEAQLSAIEKLLAVADIITHKYQNLGKNSLTKYESLSSISEKEALFSKNKSRAVN